MRGRKFDDEYFSQYIENLVCSGICEDNSILKKINDEISDIDKKISEICILKSKRNKLLQIKDFFEKKQEKKNIYIDINIEEAKKILKQFVVIKNNTFKKLINLDVLKIENNILKPSTNYKDFILYLGHK